MNRSIKIKKFHRLDTSAKRKKNKKHQHNAYFINGSTVCQQKQTKNTYGRHPNSSFFSKNIFCPFYLGSVSGSKKKQTGRKKTPKNQALQENLKNLCKKCACIWGQNCGQENSYLRKYRQNMNNFADVSNLRNA